MSFADTVRETHIQDALAASKADRELWSQLREIARVTSARRQSLTEVIHLQAPDPSGDASKGSFLLKIVSVIDATWTTVHQGKTDRLFFYTQDVAMLHLIASAPATRRTAPPPRTRPVSSASRTRPRATLTEDPGKARPGASTPGRLFRKILAVHLHLPVARARLDVSAELPRRHR